MIDIKGLSKRDVFKALYDRANPQGMGFMAFRPGPITDEQADDLMQMAGPRLYFDYVQGRVMKVSLKDDDGFDERLYDRDNGFGAAAEAIAKLRG